jgi:hypothetical protein
VSGAVNVAETVCEVLFSLTVPRTLIDVYLPQINYNFHLGHRMTSGAAIPLMPNSSRRFTGRTEIIARLKDHFSKDSDNEQHRSRKYFLLHGIGGIGKTQICLSLLRACLTSRPLELEHHINLANL